MTTDVASSNLGDVMLAFPSSSRVLAVIPARLASSRLPRKPLHRLAGRPLLEWVWKRAAAMTCFDSVVVATDSREVLDIAAAFGARAELTDPAHPSGTDRVAEIAGHRSYRDFEVLVNVQGDEPFITEAQVRGALAWVRDRGWPLGTIGAPIRSAAEWHNPAVVKVVRNDAGGAMLFSRAPIPHPRDAEPDFSSGHFLRHAGVYAYTRNALLQWVALPEHPLEAMERLEQLRPLAAGLQIGVATVEHIEGGVDTAEDAVRADRRLREIEPVHVNS